MFKNFNKKIKNLFSMKIELKIEKMPVFTPNSSLSVEESFKDYILIKKSNFLSGYNLILKYDGNTQYWEDLSINRYYNSDIKYIYNIKSLSAGLKYFFEGRAKANFFQKVRIESSDLLHKLCININQVLISITPIILSGILCFNSFKKQPININLQSKKDTLYIKEIIIIKDTIKINKRC